MDDVGNSSTKRGNTRNWKTPNAATHQKHKKVTTAPRQPAGNAEETHHRVNTHTENTTI